MDYCGHICEGATQSSPSYVDGFQQSFRGLLKFDVFSNRHSLATQTQIHKPRPITVAKVSNKLQSCVPPAQAFTAKTLLAASTVLNHLHSLRISLVRRAFDSERFFPKYRFIVKKTPTGMLLRTLKP